MRINALSEKSKVFLEATRDDSTQEWVSRVCQITEKEDLIAIQKLASRFAQYDFCFIDPIMANGMIVDFGSKEVKKNLVHTKAQEPYAWKNVVVFNVTLPKYGRAHAIAAASEDRPHNRRGSYRIRIVKPGEVYLPGEQYARNVIVNDISATGIGLIVDDVEGFYNNEKLNIKFFDENRFDVKANIRRIHEIEPHRNIVGCEFDNFSDSIAQFVNNKQLKMRREMKEREDRR